MRRLSRTAATRTVKGAEFGWSRVSLPATHVLKVASGRPIGPREFLTHLDRLSIVSKACIHIASKTGTCFFTENDTVLSMSLACTKVLLAFVYLNDIALNTNRDVHALKEL
jgi:hypothetical protein